MLLGFEKGVLGMEVGETKELQMGPEDAYGEWDERGLQQFPVDKMPEDTEVGTQLQTHRIGPARAGRFQPSMYSCWRQKTTRARGESWGTTFTPTRERASRVKNYPAPTAARGEVARAK